MKKLYTLKYHVLEMKYFPEGPEEEVTYTEKYKTRLEALEAMKKVRYETHDDVPAKGEIYFKGIKIAILEAGSIFVLYSRARDL